MAKYNQAGWARLALAVVALCGVGAAASCNPGDIAITRFDESDMITDEPDGTDTVSTPLNPDTGCSEPGALRCNESWLETCEVGSAGALPGSDAGGQWRRKQDCATPELCVEQPAQCLPKACSFQEGKCNLAVAEVCNAGLTGWEAKDTCLGPGYCSVNDEACGGSSPCCLDDPCEAGELRCSGGRMERCANDTWEELDTCETNALCDNGLAADSCTATGEGCECPVSECGPGDTRCTGLVLERCNDGQTDWEFVQECASTALCEIGRSGGGLACERERCSPGTFECDGADLLVCNDDRTAYEFSRTCVGGAAQCDRVVGDCDPPPCQPGQTLCDGAQIVTCRADQSGYEPRQQPGSVCDTPQLCAQEPSDAFPDTGRAVCNERECDPNQFFCAGNQLQVCNAGLTGVVNIGAGCPRADLCSAARQRCDFCVPSQRECTPNLTASRTCSATGNFFGPETPCPLGCIPESGLCITCEIGQYRCQGGQLSRCNNGFSFTPLGRGNDCSGSAAVSCLGNSVTTAPCGALGCNPQRNVCNECAGQQSQCSSTTSFRSCQVGGTFGPETACEDGLLCSAGQCVCTPGAAFCDDEQLLACSAGGNAIVAGDRCGGAGANILRTCDAGVLTTNTCASAALCGDASGAQCPQCVGNERDCSGNPPRPRQCTDGVLELDTPCGEGLSCVGAGLCRCEPGALRCLGATLQQCGVGGIFAPGAACSGATLRSCSGGQLSVTQCDSAALCLGATGGSCPECLAGEPPGCSDDVTAVVCTGGVLVEQACGADEACVSGEGCQL